MTYRAVVRVRFPFAHKKVYAGLTDLGRLPLWNAGMVGVSHDGVMKEGLWYETRSIVVGLENKARVKVVRLLPGKGIELKSSTGFIAFTARYELIELGRQETEVVCHLAFELKKVALTLAHPVVEAMATTRIRGDLETLRSLLAG